MDSLIPLEDIPIRGQNLSKSFRRKGGAEVALFRDLSLALKPGEIVGLSGISGQGKSTLGNILLGLLPANEGSVMWQGKKLEHLSREEYRTLRPRYQKIHQDPGSSFSPRHRLNEIFQDFFRWGKHSNLSDREEWNEKLREGMKKASLSEKLLLRYPWQLSGGELQRFALLRALLFDPFFLVADEPTSRLDSSVQARVARFLAEEARERKIAVLFISHEEALLKVLCSRILRLETSSLKGKNA